MADDNETIVVERLHLDKNDPNILHNEMTTTDNSLTRPWSAITDYHRNPNAVWREDACLANPYVTISKQVYMLSSDGRLMPLKKNQLPPDLGYFKSTTNGPWSARRFDGRERTGQCFDEAGQSSAFEDAAEGASFGPTVSVGIGGYHRGQYGGMGYGLHLTGVTSSGVPFLELIQPFAVRRHGHCSVYGPPRPSVTCNAMSSSSGALSIGFQP
jgi:hypothetical protein